MPLSTHLAEMPEELRLLEHRDGPMRQFLEDLGAWDDEWEPIGPRPADYVRRGELRNADWLIAHGTYLEPDDFWQLRPEAAPDGHRVADRLLSANSCPVRPCPPSLPRAARTRRDRLPRDRQPGVRREPEHPRRDSIPAPSRRVALRFSAADHGDALRRLGAASRNHDRQPASPANRPTWRSSPFRTVRKPIPSASCSNPTSPWSARSSKAISSPGPGPEFRALHAWVERAEKGDSDCVEKPVLWLRVCRGRPGFFNTFASSLRHTRHPAHWLVARDPRGRPGP